MERVVETIRSEEVLEDTSLVKFACCPFWYVRISRCEHRFNFCHSTETVDTGCTIRIVDDIYGEFNELPDAHTRKGPNHGSKVNRLNLSEYNGMRAEYHGAWLNFLYSVKGIYSCLGP